MGDRANYAIRRSGKVELFYSHWGALTVPEDLFFGPSYAEAFIRQNETADEWLDTVWAEGGAALDHDTKTVALFGGDRLGYPPHQPLVLELMQALWGREGWTVRWVEDLGGIATLVGVADGAVRAEYQPPLAVDPTRAASGVPDGYASTLIVVRRGDVRDERAVTIGCEYLLMVGPPLLDAVERYPTVAEAVETLGERPLKEYESERTSYWGQVASVLAIDPEARRVDAYERFHDARAEPFQAAAWPGWTLVHHGAPATRWFEDAGLPVPAGLQEAADMAALHADVSAPGEDELLTDIAEALLGERADPSRMVASLAAEGDHVWVNPSALRSPVDVRPDADTARRLFAGAVAARAGGYVRGGRA